MATASQSQAYDNVLKRWFERHAREIIPLILEERDLAEDKDKNIVRQKRSKAYNLGKIEEMNIEVLIPPRRNDRIYRSPYKGKMHVIDIEIETSPNGLMAIRSLIYHGLLMEKYREPIMSMILYPFKMSIVKSPLQETNGDGESLTFCFRTLPLWRFDAQKYFAERNIGMFALLPAMRGATQSMLSQALDFMVQWYRDKQDEAGFREDVITFGILMRRAAILPPAHIEEVTAKMVYYDPLIMEDPHFGKLIREAAAKEAIILADAIVEEIAEAKAKVLAKAQAKILAEAQAKVLAEAQAKVLAEAQAKVLAEAQAKVLSLASMKHALLRIVEVRFPHLLKNLREMALPDNQEALEQFLVQVATASSENAVCNLFGLPVN